MHSRFTRFIAGGVVALSLFSAVGVAQASALSQTQISAIVGLLQAFGADSSVIANVTATLNGQQPTAPTASASSCGSFAFLKRGDTDARVGGWQVTKLQQYLGIYPTTGTYGPLTQIGYTNKCVGGNSQPSAVAGMSQYTDSSFGFSFWYPSGWQISKSPYGDSTIEITEQQSAHFPRTIRITKMTQDDGLLNAGGACGSCAQIKYYFDTAKHAWMQIKDPEGNGGITTTADVSNNTMGGLHILPDGARFGGSVVPLSAKNFLVIIGDDGGLSYNVDAALTKTIVATDPTVATPLPTAQQVQTIQAEATAYGVSASSATTARISAIISEAVPLTAIFTVVPTGLGSHWVEFGDGTRANATCAQYKPDTDACLRMNTIAHTYATAGTYTAVYKEQNTAAGGDSIGSVTVSVSR